MRKRRGSFLMIGQSMRGATGNEYFIAGVDAAPSMSAELRR